MRPKEGTKIELQRDLSDFVRFVRFSGLDLSDLSDLPISAIKKKRTTDGPTDGRTDQRTDRASYRDAWTHLRIKIITEVQVVGVVDKLLNGKLEGGRWESEFATVFSSEYRPFFYIGTPFPALDLDLQRKYLGGHLLATVHSKYLS